MRGRCRDIILQIVGVRIDEGTRHRGYQIKAQKPRKAWTIRAETIESLGHSYIS